ncbi:fkbp-type peptidyl-prolyl cis-trans protein [Cystoisospora suis]|uniref:peptidylprolyl isomerase n=1 Tax=Cystoisospora suis TaxID=483139 RepID=A0A2C6L1Y9_9APIC|nr:fkbp-type peptidyl-prolyl cis-trans protein [Cystoisospora suis]
MAKPVENQQMPFFFLASSSTGLSGSSSSYLSCSPPIFPPCFPSSVIDRLVDEAGPLSSKIEESKASFPLACNSGRPPKGDGTSPVEDICGDGSVLFLRIRPQRAGLPRFQKQEGGNSTGVTDADVTKQEELRNKGVEGHRPSGHLKKAEAPLGVPGAKKKLDQTNARGEAQPLDTENAGRGEVKTEGLQENIADNAGEEEILRNSDEKEHGQEEERALFQHCTRQPDNICPWPGCLACISVVASAFQEDPSFSFNITVPTLRQSERPELELSRFLLRVGNTDAVPECVSLALTEMRPGDVVRLYVHPSRGFRTLQGKSVRQLAAEDDFLLVDLTLHYWTVFEEITGDFDFFSSTLFPPKRKEGGKNGQECATSSRPSAAASSTSSIPSVNGDDSVMKAVSQQTPSVFSTDAPVKAGEKNSSSKESALKTEIEEERKDRPGCSVSSDVIITAEGRDVDSSERESKKKDDQTEGVESEEKDKPDKEGRRCCDDEDRGHVFLFSYSRLKKRDVVWMDEKSPEDSRSYYYYQPYSDHEENRDLTEVEIAYILESSHSHVASMASIRGEKGENRENTTGRDNKITEEGMPEESTVSSPNSCCSSIPTSPSCCSSHLDHQDHDSSVSFPGHLPNSCTCDSSSPPPPFPLSETGSTGTPSSPDAQQPSSPPQLCEEEEEAPSDSSSHGTEKEKTVTVCRFRLDEDEAPFPGLEVLARHMRVGDMADAWLSGSFVVPTSSLCGKDEDTLSQRNQAHASSRTKITHSLSGTASSFSASLHLQQNGDTETAMPRCLPSSLCPSNGTISFPTKADATSTTIDKEGHDSSSADEGMKCEGLISFREEKKEERQLGQSPPCCLSLRGVVLRKAEHVPEPHQLRFVEEKMDMAKVLRVNGSGWYKKGRPDRALKRYLQSERFLTHLGGDASEDDVAKARPELIITRLNIAQCHLVLGNYFEAKILSVDAENIKALYRLSKALEGLEDYFHAHQTARRALQLQPSNRDLCKLVAAMKHHLHREDEEHKGYCKGIFTK